MNKKLAFLIVLITLFSILSCSRATLTEVVKYTQTVTPISIFTPTIGVLQTPTIAETPVTLQKISQACIELDVSNKSKTPLKGVAVFDNLSQQLVDTIFLHDLENSNLTTLSPPGPIWRLWGISPDRRHLLYEYETLSGNNYQLALTDSKGHIIKKFDTRFPNDLWNASYYNWQNDENIRVILSFDSQGPSRISPRMYNLFTGDYRVLQTDFPDYVAKDLDWRLDWIALSTLRYQGTNLVYDPLFAHVLYPKKGEIVSLTDVKSGKELASVHLSNWGRLPKWSPDGNYLALIATNSANSAQASDEIFVVQRDGGEFKRMTYLSDSFKQSAIADYAWSPDGTKIAFWSYTDIGDPKTEGTQSKLMLLDVKTGEVTNLCIQGISATTHLNDVVLFASLEPIWSPDGNQIMISQWATPEDKNNKNFNVFVVDLSSLKAVKIDQNKQPVGWMTKEP